MRKEYEKDIQSAILQYLRLKRFVAFKHHSTGFTASKDGGVRTFKYGDKGITDIIACDTGGKFWGIEVKRRKGKVSDDQTYFIEQIRKNGGHAFVAYSLDDVIAEVERKK